MTLLTEPTGTRWSDAALDAARRRADPLADAVVAGLFANGGVGAVRGLMAHLVTNDQIVPDALPPAVRDYLAATSVADPRDVATIDAGEKVFAAHGPEILLILCCSSLPSAYAARKGVQVLHRTAYLAKRPNRRLFETSQMIIDVMTPGGLGPGGRGLRAAQKVRLMHAAVRHLILNDPSQPWPADDLGLPINQEDMLGTLMTFSWIILRGLAHIGVPLAPNEAQAYTDTWMHVGRVMGLESDLLPTSVAETQIVSDIIERRQVAESAEGREMTAALLGMMQDNLPRPLHSVPAALVREFLPTRVADALAVPNHPFEQALIAALDLLVRPFERWYDGEASRHVALRVFAVRMLQWMQAVELGDARASFTIPASLNEAWQSAPAGSEEGFWQKLKTWEAARG